MAPADRDAPCCCSPAVAAVVAAVASVSGPHVPSSRSTQSSLTDTICRLGPILSLWRRSGGEGAVPCLACAPLPSAAAAEAATAVVAPGYGETVLGGKRLPLLLLALPNLMTTSKSGPAQGSAAAAAASPPAPQATPTAPPATAATPLLPPVVAVTAPPTAVAFAAAADKAVAAAGRLQYMDLSADSMRPARMEA